LGGALLPSTAVVPPPSSTVASWVTDTLPREPGGSTFQTVP
jgi:hypothetical protein